MCGRGGLLGYTECGVVAGSKRCRAIGQAKDTEGDRMNYPIGIIELKYYVYCHPLLYPKQPTVVYRDTHDRVARLALGNILELLRQGVRGE